MTSPQDDQKNDSQTTTLQSDTFRPAVRQRIAAVASAASRYQDDADRVFDFHALRHQFFSSLAAAGVHPKTAHTLARHSTINLTMDRYTHVRLNDVAGASDGLPALPATPAEVQPMKATGTDGELALQLVLKDVACPDVSSNVASPKVELLPKPIAGETFGVIRRPLSANREIRPEGLEPPTDGLEISRNMQDSTGKTGISQVIGPPTGPRLSNGQKSPLVEGHTSATDVDQDLSLVINAWHSLAEPIRRAILALIGAASN